MALSRPTKRRSLHLGDPIHASGDVGFPEALPSKYYDHLSEVLLTSGALQEQQRRRRKEAKAAALHTAKPRVQPSPHLDQSYSMLSADDFCRKSPPGSIRALQRFSRHGGPSLRLWQDMSRRSDMSATASRSSTGAGIHKRTSGASSSAGTTTTVKNGPYDANFASILVDAGIYDLFFDDADLELSRPPDNMPVIQERLRTRRPSLSVESFTAQEFNLFERHVDAAKLESQVLQDVLPFVRGHGLPPGTSSGQFPFGNLAPLESLPTSKPTVPGNPDVYDGAPFDQLTSPIRDDLCKLIVPSSFMDRPALPNFVMAVKSAAGSGGGRPVARRQIRYDGALCARGMHAMLTYGLHEPAAETDESVSHAQILSCIFDAEFLQIYTTTRRYSARHSRAQYYLHRLGSWSLTGSRENFVAGATAFRNARDWAQEARYNAVQKALSRIAQSASAGSSKSVTATPISSESAVSTRSATTGITEPSARNRSTAQKRRSRR